VRRWAPRAAAISPATAWYSMPSWWGGLAPSSAVAAFTLRYIVAAGVRMPGWGVLLNIVVSLLRLPCLSTREVDS
jgi:hypothetical protein